MISDSKKSWKCPINTFQRGLVLIFSQAHNIPTVVHVHSGMYGEAVVSRLHISIMGVSVTVIFELVLFRAGMTI